MAYYQCGVHLEQLAAPPRWVATCSDSKHSRGFGLLAYQQQNVHLGNELLCFETIFFIGGISNHNCHWTVMTNPTTNVAVVITKQTD